MALAAPAFAQAPLRPGEKAMSVRLIAETDAPASGGKVELALLMTPKPGWHGYWKNPGDAGVETKVEWRLPPGVAAGPLRFPVPDTLIVAGFMNYVYKGEFAHLVALEIPAGLAPGTILPIRARVAYVVCTDKVCVPESADLALDLRVGTGARNEEFDRYREALPRPLGSDGRFERVGDRLRIAIPIPASLPLATPYFFPATLDALDHGAPQNFSRAGDLLVLETRAGRETPAALDGVLRLGGRDGLSLTAGPGPVPPAGAPLTARAAIPDGISGVLLAFGAALLGGLLLNVMPCVFPILSLKALSLAGAGGEEGRARRDALAYTAGAILTCLALGALLLALRSGGSAAGWAFQLQDPRIILFLLLLVVAIALNLAGLFELPAVSGGGRLARAGGAAGSFWTGALAAFVATPCTGPFMAAALGAALILPTAAALAIFAGLGLGLALPFLLLGFVPFLRRRLPRPGPWMVRFRHILAIPMALTALALLWLLWRLTGRDGLLLGIGAAILLTAILWWTGRRAGGWLRFAPAALALALAPALAPAAVAPSLARARGLLQAKPFSEARLARLRSEGRPVFVYFTADWCLTCKVNEAAALETEAVAEAFKRRDVAILVGDWTRGDADIGRFLQSHGRAGVPLYLWYAPGKEAEILPQILTPGTVTALAD
ncbi:MAG TPA: thioredoxin family protein [Allosphingosinicella sp.]